MKLILSSACILFAITGGVETAAEHAGLSKEALMVANLPWNLSRDNFRKMINYLATSSQDDKKALSDLLQLYAIADTETALEVSEAVEQIKAKVSKEIFLDIVKQQPYSIRQETLSLYEDYIK